MPTVRGSHAIGTPWNAMKLRRTFLLLTTLALPVWLSGGLAMGAAARANDHANGARLPCDRNPLERDETSENFPAAHHARFACMAIRRPRHGTRGKGQRQCKRCAAPMRSEPLGTR